MKKRLLPILLLLFATCTYAQMGFLVLKKKDRTFKTYMPGSYIDAVHRNGSGLNGRIVKVGKDSLYISNYYIQKTGNEKGFVFFDTIYSGVTPLHIQDIRSVHVPKKNFGFQASEYTSYLAGAWFSIMSVVNGIKFKQKAGSILGEVAVRGGGGFVAGRLFHWLGREDYTLGKKYRLVTIL